MRFLSALCLVAVLFASVATTSCKHQQPATSVSTLDATKYSGGKGTSYADAVIIMEYTETPGVAAEYAWLKNKYPGYKLVSQSLNTNEGKHYDVMKITTVDNEDVTVYFDISNFFGKW